MLDTPVPVRLLKDSDWMGETPKRIPGSVGFADIKSFIASGYY